MARRLIKPAGGWFKGLGSARFSALSHAIVGTMPLSGGQEWSIAATVFQRGWGAENMLFLFGGIGRRPESGVRIGFRRPFVVAGRWLGPFSTFGTANLAFERLVITHSGGTWRRYNNGIQIKSALAGILRIQGTRFRIGEPSIWSAPSFWVHDVRMWNRALTADEVLLDQLGEYITPGLVRHLPLEEIRGGGTPELIGGTPFVVTGVVIDPNMRPWGP